MALRKGNRNLKSKHERQTEMHAKIIDDLKIEITKLKDNTTEINSRMVTKADLLTQEIRLNKTASLSCDCGLILMQDGERKIFEYKSVTIM